MKKFLFALTAIIFLFAGCDYVKVPKQAGGSIIVPTSDTIRRIFIDEFTGHVCPNCPRAARAIDSLKLHYPGQIISMAIHTGSFGAPCNDGTKPAGSLAGSFEENFTDPTDDANFQALWDVNDLPFPAMFLNRSGYTAGTMVIGTPIQLESSVPLVISKPMTAYLKITPNYNSATRVLNVSVAGKFMVDTTGAYNIALYLTEDSLIGAQFDYDYPGLYNYNYVFNEVLRGCINSPGTVTGVQIITGTIAANTGISYTSPSFTVNSSYNAAHCHIIAILAQGSPPNGDYGVLQAAESKLIP